MSENDENVGVPPTFRDTLQEILAHAATQERTVIEFKTEETASGRTHFSSALEITEHVCELEEKLDTTPER